MWNLKKIWYRQSHLQSRNRDTNIKNKCMDTNGKGAGMNWEIGIDVHAKAVLSHSVMSDLFVTP